MKEFMCESVFPNLHVTGLKACIHYITLPYLIWKKNVCEYIHALTNTYACIFTNRICFCVCKLDMQIYFKLAFFF